MGRDRSINSLLKPEPKRAPQNIQVEGLKMTSLQASIKWRGMVRLHQLNEDSESYLAEIEWPKLSGRLHYACASTGLLFDKQSGRCQQSSAVTLRLDTVEETKCTPAQFGKWHTARILSGPRDICLKRGPKPKGATALVTLEAEDECY